MARVALSSSMGRPVVRRALLLITLVLVAALGCWRIVVMSRPASEADVLTIRGVTYSVTHVEQVTGLSEQDLSGMSHGIQGLVSDDKVLIRISMIVRADSASRTYDPSALTIADTAGGTPISPVGGSLAPGGLGARAQIEGSLAFIVPRNGQHLRLHAPRNANAIDLLSVDRAPAGAPTHEHGLNHDNGPAHEHDNGPAHEHGADQTAPHRTAPHDHP